MNEHHLIRLLRIGVSDEPTVYDEFHEWLRIYGYIEERDGRTQLKNKGEEAVSLAIVSINARFED
jgi:hypothetical protein